MKPAVLAVFASVLLASCGSGGVSDSSVTRGGPLAITPSTATLYSDLPTTFIVNGGTGSYIILSSDQNVVPVASSVKGGSFVVIPTEVISDTAVTLTVRDSNDGTLAPASAVLTVKPRTVNNVVTVTPSASQSAACGTAICSGGDAEVKASLSQGGGPLVGREVRFDVVSGDIRIITSAPGMPEIDSLSGTATTDSTGSASARIRVLADATAQTALLQITDLSSGFTQRTSVTIAPSSNAPLNAQPATVVFQGLDPGTCASGISADVIVFGGRPPYLISQPGSFGVFPTVITENGGRFTITAIGQCSAGSQIAIVDGNGTTVSVTATNTLSDVIGSPTPTPTDFVVSPTEVKLAFCTDVGTVSLAGGSGQYVAASGSTSILASVSNNIGTIRRSNLSSAPGASTVTVQFSDGSTTLPVTVNLSGEAAGACPPPAAPAPLTLNPSSDELKTCSDVINVQVTGGSGNYTESSSSTVITLGGFTNFFSVQRRTGTDATGIARVSVDVSDGQSVAPLPITLSGSAAGSCS
jgi:hypothetical protein